MYLGELQQSAVVAGMLWHTKLLKCNLLYHVCPSCAPCRQERQAQQPAGAAALPPALPLAVQAGPQHYQMQAAQQSVQLLPARQQQQQQQPPTSTAAASQPFAMHLPIPAHLANNGTNSSSTAPISAAKRKAAALGADLDSQAAGKRPVLMCMQHLQPLS